MLDNPAPGQYFRIRTTDVSDSEANQYLYYQNVSLLEAELYEEVPLSYSLGELTIEIREDAAAIWSFLRCQRMWKSKSRERIMSR